MIANFFQHLERGRVEHLLISGQASVLYGAATFSEDVDLWIRPDAENVARLTAALRACAARFYKLTPPLSAEILARGHGFHFVLPGGDEAETYLDVMGHPPRVGPFDVAARSARWFETGWGRLHTVGLHELVELKKTQRVEDYAVIGRLALLWVQEAGHTLSASDARWAVRHVFTPADLRALCSIRAVRDAVRADEELAGLRTYCGFVEAGADVPEELEDRLAEGMQMQMSGLQREDRRYWRAIIAELKDFRAAGKLMAEGEPV